MNKWNGELISAYDPKEFDVVNAQADPERDPKCTLSVKLPRCPLLQPMIILDIIVTVAGSSQLTLLQLNNQLSPTYFRPVGKFSISIILKLVGETIPQEPQRFFL